MSKPFRAIYENGVFRPLELVEGLTNHTTVRIRVEQLPTGNGKLSDLEGLWSKEDATEIEALIESEFRRVDPSEW